MISILELTILDTLDVVESVDFGLGSDVAVGDLVVDLVVAVDLEASVGTAVASVLKIVAFEVVENFVNWVDVGDCEEGHSIFVMLSNYFHYWTFSILEGKIKAL